MRTFTSSLLLAGFLMVFFTQCKSQQTVLNKPTESQLLTAAKEIMISAKNCALITQDSLGRSKVRTMDPFLPEEDFTVWFGTNSRSRKVKEIEKDNRVTLYYFNAKIQGYVTILGTATLINNSQTKEEKWKDAWADFYPDKETDYMLIKVTPQRLEVLSPHHHINNDPSTWMPPFVIFDKP